MSMIQFGLNYCITHTPPNLYNQFNKIDISQLKLLNTQFITIAICLFFWKYGKNDVKNIQ